MHNRLPDVLDTLDKEPHAAIRNNARDGHEVPRDNRDDNVRAASGFGRGDICSDIHRRYRERPICAAVPVSVQPRGAGTGICGNTAAQRLPESLRDNTRDAADLARRTGQADTEDKHFKGAETRRRLSLHKKFTKLPKQFSCFFGSFFTVQKSASAKKALYVLVLAV